MTSLYDTDIVLWSEQQADRLRRLARGEQPNDIDWENVVEEIESVGRSEISAVRSLLLRALEHMLKAAAWPEAASARKWLHEARTFLRDARFEWAPRMAQRLDLAELYAEAVATVQDLAFEEGSPGPLPAACPVTLSELLTGDVLHVLAPRFREPPVTEAP